MTDNQIKLREYKRLYGLNSADVARMLDVSIRTVNSWLVKIESVNYRPMPNREIKFLKCLLKTKRHINTN